MRIDQETIHRRIAELLDLRKPFVVATILDAKGSCPQEPGTKMIIHSDGSFEFTIGGGTFEAEVIQDGLALLKTNSPHTRDYKLTKSELGMYCQGLVKVFFEKYIPRPQLLIFGGGHVSQALSRFGAATELFSVVVVDDRKEYANRKKHPSAKRIIHTDRTFTKKVPPVDEETYIAILTRCHATDKLLVQKYADSKAAYIGLIGSQAKIRQFARELEQEGVSAKKFERIHAPVGLPIGGKNPSEIAVSILAEMIQVRNSKRTERSLDLKVKVKG
jgi:xanthine dehydrogenase accessory factor